MGSLSVDFLLEIKTYFAKKKRSPPESTPNLDPPQVQMNTVQNPSQLVIEQAQLQLRMWWNDLDKDGQNWVKKQLGPLIDIMSIKPREDLIKALVTFWDPLHNVFCFSDFELTPTLEEMAGCIDFG